MGLPPITIVSDDDVAGCDPGKADGRIALLRFLTGRPVGLECPREGERCRQCSPCLAYEQTAFEVRDGSWGKSSLDRLLLLCALPRVSDGFYEAFFGTDLRDGVSKFRAYAMLAYGSFETAFNELHDATEPEIRAALGRLALSTGDLEGHYNERKERVTDLDLDEILTPIPGKDRWHVGTIWSGPVATDQDVAAALSLKILGGIPHDASELAREIAAAFKPEDLASWDKDQVTELLRRQAQMLETRTRTQQAAERNSVHYMAAPAIDVYVATSMRDPWEFEEAADDIAAIFGHSDLAGLGIVHFDPTLADMKWRIDKGLLEGLMLDEAEATLYLAQESDTLGKDSELAATLAHGKPVVVYVPSPTEQEVAAAFRAHPWRALKRGMILLSQSKFAGPAVKPLLELVGDKWNPLLKTDPEYETWFGDTYKSELDVILPSLAEAHIKALNDRAGLMSQIHPLGMQLHLMTGVACGILVARTRQRAVGLLRAALTNSLTFEIRREGADGTTLREAGEEDPTKRSPYRVVTANRVLSNSFWADFGRAREVSPPLAPGAPPVGAEDEPNDARPRRDSKRVGY